MTVIIIILTVDIDDLLDITIAFQLRHIGSTAKEQWHALMQVSRLDLKDSSSSINGPSTTILHQET